MRQLPCMFCASIMCFFHCKTLNNQIFFRNGVEALFNATLLLSFTLKRKRRLVHGLSRCGFSCRWSDGTRRHVPIYTEAQQWAHHVLDESVCVRVQPKPPARSLSQHALFSTLLHNTRAESNRQLPALNNYGKQHWPMKRCCIYPSPSVHSHKRNQWASVQTKTEKMCHFCPPFTYGSDQIGEFTEGLLIYNINTDKHSMLNTKLYLNLILVLEQNIILT